MFRCSRHGNLREKKVTDEKQGKVLPLLPFLKMNYKIKKYNNMITRFLFIMMSLFITFSLSAQSVVTKEAVTLKTATGDIYGTLKVPLSKKTVPIALIISGSGPTDRNGNNSQMKNNSLEMLSDGLFYKGIATLCFDKRGIAESKDAGKSEADLRFEDYINDVKDWINLLSDDNRFSDIIVIGHSEGSLIGMVAAQNNPKVKKYVSIAGIGQKASDILKWQLEKQLVGQPESVKDMIFSYIDKIDKGETISDVPSSLNALFRPSVQPYMISWFKYDPQIEIGKLNIPILIIQGTTDIQVTEEQAELLAKGNTKAKKVIIQNMDHVLKNSETTDQMAQYKSSYTNPTSPIKEEVVKEIADFIK